MNDNKIPGLLTPEVIEAISKNASAMKNILNSGEEAALVNAPCGGHKGEDKCCSPKIVKIKNILCYVWIENENAAAVEEEKHPRPRC